MKNMIILFLVGILLKTSDNPWETVLNISQDGAVILVALFAYIL